MSLIGTWQRLYKWWQVTTSRIRVFINLSYPWVSHCQSDPRSGQWPQEGEGNWGGETLKEDYAEQEDYAEPSNEKCTKGKRQSPININTQTVRYQEFPPFKLEGHDKLALRLGKLTIRNKKGNVICTTRGQTYHQSEAEKRLVPQDGGLLSGGPLRAEVNIST